MAIVQVPIEQVPPGGRFSLHEDGYEKYPLLKLDAHDDILRRKWLRIEEQTGRTITMWVTWDGKVSWGSETHVWVEQRRTLHTT